MLTKMRLIWCDSFGHSDTIAQYLVEYSTTCCDYGVLPFVESSQLMAENKLPSKLRRSLQRKFRYYLIKLRICSRYAVDVDGSCDEVPILNFLKRHTWRRLGTPLILGAGKHASTRSRRLECIFSLISRWHANQLSSATRHEPPEQAVMKFRSLWRNFDVLTVSRRLRSL